MRCAFALLLVYSFIVVVIACQESVVMFGLQIWLLVRSGHTLYTCTFSIRKHEEEKMINNISRHVLWLVGFPVQNMPGSGFSMVHV